MAVAGAVALGLTQWGVPVASAAPALAVSSLSGAAVTTPLLAADVRSAQLTARVRGVRVQVLSESTEVSSTWVNPDGTFTSELNAQPVQAEVAAGVWKPLDGTLSARPDGAVAPAVSATGVSFAGAGSKAAARLGTGAGALGLDWFSNLPAPTLNGSVATYPNVLANTDLTATSTATGFELSLVVKSKPAVALPAVVTMSLKGTGLTWSLNSAGVLTGVDGAGKAVVTSSRAKAWDSTRDPHTGDPLHVVPLTLSLSGAVGAQKLSVSVPTALLGDPGTVYPVTIDPTTTWSKTGWTYVSSAFPTTSYYNANDVARVGAYATGKANRSLFAFGTSNLTGKHIISATISATETWSWSCSARAFSIQSAGAFSSTTTWNTQPAHPTTYATITAAKGYSSACPAGVVSANFTSWATAAAANGLARNYIEFNANEADFTYWKKFNPAVSISVTYNSLPGTPTGRTISPCTGGCASPVYSNTSTPKLTANTTDPEGSALRYDFEVWAGNSASPTTRVSFGSSAFIGSGATAAWTVPAGALVNGSTYEYRVRAFDGTDYGPWSTGWAIWVVDTTAPNAPTVTSTGFPENQWSTGLGSDGEAHFTAKATTADSTKLQWSLDSTTYGTSAAVSGTTTSVDIALAAPTAGKHTINVRSVDTATNAGAAKAYTFYYGSGVAVAQPLENQVTARRLPLQLTVDPTLVPSLGSPSFEYRRGDADTWHPVPLADLTNPAGANVTAWPAQADSTTVYYWDAATTLSGVGGVIDVHAKFSTNAPATPLVTATVDINDGQAGSAAAGPGSVNLSTGALSVSGSDADWFGVGIGRSYSSRSLTAGTSDGQAGAFGPQWSSGASGSDSSYTMVALTSPTSVDVLTAGDRTSFTLKAGTSGVTANWVPQPGAEDLQLIGDPAGTTDSVFTLTTTDRMVTTFKKPASGPAGAWPVYGTTSSGDDNAARYASSVDGFGKLRLSVIAAPNPGLTPAELDACATAPVPVAGPARGCRVLALSWGDVTTDTGTQSRVNGIDAWAWDPATSTMTKTTLAGFGYDAHGWLTSATDTITNLVTDYGYDASSGLLTSLTPAHAPSTPTARLPWTFGYAGAGVTAAPVWDRTTQTSGGRLVTVTRATLVPGSLTTTNGTASTAFVYGVPVTKAGHGPVDVAATDAASWGQNDPALEGTAVFDVDAAAQPGANTDFWAGDDTTTRSWTAASVTYIDVNGREVNHFARDGGLDAASYDIDGNQVFALSAGNRAIATGEAPGADDLGLSGQDPAVIGQQLATVSGYQAGTITSAGDEPAQRPAYTAGPLHTVVTAAGDQALERAVTRDTYDQGRPGSIAGSTVPPVADVVTSTVTGGAAYLADPATATLDDPRTTTKTYDWALGESPAVTVDPSPAAGDEITTSTSYDTAGRAISATMPGGTAAGTTLTSYYDTATTAPCTGHPEWGGMVCTKAAQGPVASGANPQLVSTTLTYTRNGAPAVVVESANGINRTTTMTYDSAERPSTVAVAATDATGAATTVLGAGVATRTMTYDPDTGDTTAVSATIAGATQTINTSTDALGRPISVTDGTGLTGSTQYDTQDRPTKLTQTDTTNTLPGGGHRTFATTSTYDATTGHLDATTDDQAGITTLGYDIDGAISSQAVTTGAGLLTMTQATDPTGAPTTRQWQLAGATGPLTFEQVTGNIHGQWIDHTTTAATVRRYTYDHASRLTAVTNLDSGAACTARSYSYNTNSDRLGEAATAPALGGAPSATNPTGCTTPPAPATTHTFDSADRLTDPGYTYDTFGRTTRLPLGGATGNALTGQVMRVGYNVNDLVATQSVYANATDADAAAGAGQNPTSTQTYTLDATGQRLQTFTKTGVDPDTGLPVITTKTNRYATASDSPSWIDEGTTGPAANTLTRNITGPPGGLLATTSNPAAGGAGALVWQLTSLHGDIAVTLPDDTYQAVQAVPLSDEFGVPDPGDTTTRGADNRYGWLGGQQRSTEAPGGIVLMGVRIYNPSTGRFLSADPVQGGNDNAYVYPPDPVNKQDLDGRYGYSFTYTTFWDPWFSPHSVLRAVVNAFWLYFPIPSNCSSLRVGAVCSLAGNPVRVRSVGYASFSLLSLHGHTEGPGKIITFSFTRSWGQHFLRVTASGPNNTRCNSNRACAALNNVAAYFIWRSFAARVGWL